MRSSSPIAALVIAACGHAAAPRPAPAPAPGPAPAPTASPVAVPPAASGPPVARTVDVTETLFGVKVSDPYRWMEGSDNAELDAWLRAQGAHARAYLDALPGRDKLYQRIRELGLGTTSIGTFAVAGDRVFFERIDAGEQLAKLYVRDKDGSERALVDPSKLGEGEHHASVNAFAPSPDGSMIAYDIALGGGEVSQLHVMDVKTGKDLPEVIDRVWGEFAAAWMPDGKSFLYAQMAAPKTGVDPMLDGQVRIHVMGAPVDKDVALLGGGAPSAWKVAPDEFPIVYVVPGSPWVIALAAGARSELRVAIAPLGKLDRTGAGKTPWREVADYKDGVADLFPHGDRLYLFTYGGAPNYRIVSVPLAAPELAKAKVEVAERPDIVLTGIGGAKDGLYIRTNKAGLAGLERLDWRGKRTTIALPKDGWIDAIATDPLRDGGVFRLQGWTFPSTLERVDVKGKVTPSGLADASSADFSNIVVEETSAKSSDGTDVPLSILHQKDAALDGSHPALVYAYGGYGISSTPAFQPVTLAWLERGGVFAVCHVRGGGEKGHQWQIDGTHEHKLNGVHDFEACGQSLIDRKLTTSARLFGRAGSMGGVLIGRTITDRPDLYAAINDAVGMNNPLRILASDNGADQLGELGDPRTEDGFTSILAMDPYQHVTPGTKYPAVIFTIGLNDKRVATWETGKMAAKMLASSTSGAPILVRIDEDAGHGIGSTRDQNAASFADVAAFFLSIAGDPDFHAAR